MVDRRPARLTAQARNWAWEQRSRWRAVVRLVQSMSALSAPDPSRFASYGTGSWIVPPARVEGPEWTNVGAGVVVHEHGWLAVKRSPGRPPPCLSIGDGTRINRFVNIVCLGTVTIGRDVLVGDRAYIGDVEFPAGHVDTDGSPGEEPRPVLIGDGAFIGAGAIVKPGVTIGPFAYVSAASVVQEDVAPWTVVAGAPARAVRRLRDPEAP